MSKRSIFTLITLIIIIGLSAVAAQALETTDVVNAPVAEVEQSPTEPDSPVYQPYVVREGDNFWSIARNAGIDVATLLEINNLSNASRLDVGQVLYVPADETESPAERMPLAVVVALDNTGSMAGAALQHEVRAIQALAAGLDETAEIGLVTYSDDAVVVTRLTPDRSAIRLSLGMLAASGDGALYDGAALALTQAANAASAQKLVVLLTDGVNMSTLSDATAETTLQLSRASNIPVVAVAIGADADTAYLNDLSEAAGGRLYTAASASDLPDVAATILADLSAGTYGSARAAVASADGIPSMETVSAARNSINELASSLISPTLAESPFVQSAIQAFSGGEDAPLLSIPGINNGVVASDGNATATTITRIPPLQDGLNQLDLNDDAEAIDIPVVTNTEAQAAVAERAGQPEQAPATRINPETIADTLTSNVAPITIDVAEDADIEVAELALNGYRLQTFEQPPYSYELDTSMLDAGHYNLTFTVANEGGVMSAGSLEFAVEVVAAQPLVVAEPVNEDIEAIIPGPSPVEASAMRVLLVDGEPATLDLAFSTSGGLELVKPVETLVVPEENLFSILAEPANNLIPPTVREALMTPRPLASALIILVMTVVLLPQGLFTLYWLMYAWNNPKTIEESQSPRAFVEPEISFTALLPARHEEAVIKDTIYAVDRIDYPDHLKEVLILCRTDDQGTIDKANEAVAELGKPNIRVVTFSTGPINKPHGLNIGLGEATHDVVAVFDAEDEPHHEIYQVINTVMQRDDADVVQSGVQLMNFKSNWFSALNVLEYFFWFKSGLHCFTRQFKVTPLGGNTVFFKRHVLEQIGGWDEQCLTEDADVGIRLTALGARIQIVYDAVHATREETPDTVESFIKQRTRWNQGFYQVFFKGDWARLPTMTQRITALYILLNSLMQAAILLFLPVGLYIALTQQVAVPVAMISWVPIYLLLLQLITNLIGIREFAEAYGERLPFGFRLRMIVAYYPYQLLLAVAAGRAVIRHLTAKQSWEKTAHSNLHRQSQSQVMGRA